MKKFLKKILKFVCKFLLAFFLLSIVSTIIYKWVNPPITILMITRAIGGTGIDKKWENLDNISPYMVQAAIASEDNNFLGHNGFDFGAIRDALISADKRGKLPRGASTISQQTAKNVFLWTGRSWIRKGLEVYFTFLIEQIWGKERIMEVYLNVIETGNGIYGAQAAAKKYFGTTAALLTKQQAALITACYPNPRKRNPAAPSRYILNRANDILQLMGQVGKVDFSGKSRIEAKKQYKKYVEQKTEEYDKFKNRK